MATIPGPEFCQCCLPARPRAPRDIWNRPGLSALSYRIGTFATFREALLGAIAGEPRLAGLTTRESDDHAITLLELFAAMGDVLTFYSERHANELYLRTATERDSVLRLTRLIGYRLQPGLAATTLLSFTLDAGAETRIRKGLKVMSVPGQDEEPQHFETSEEFTAHGDLNALAVFAPPAAFNAFDLGRTVAPLLERPEPLVTGDRLIFFGLSRIEEKTVAGLTREADGERLRFKPGVQTGGWWPGVTRAAKTSRRLRFFGHSAPDSHQVYDTDPATPPQQRWTSEAIDPSLDPSDGVYPLDAAYEDLKPGTALLLDAGAAASPRLRAGVVIEAEDRHASHGPLSQTVTHATIFQAITGAPSAVVRPDGGRHVFARSGAGHALTMRPELAIGWTGFGAFVASSDLSGVSTAPLRVDLFARSEEGRLRHAVWFGLWGTFANDLGGELTSAPRALAVAGGEVVVFARRVGEELWVRGVLPASVAWQSLGGQLTSEPAPVTWGGDRIDVFARGDRRELLWFRRAGGTWSEAESLEGELSTAPAAAATASDRLDVVALDGAGKLVHRRWTGTAWTDWLNLGGESTGTPAILASGPNTVDVVVTGADGNLYHIARNGETWSDWTDLGGAPASAPALVQANAESHVYVRDAEGVLAARRRTASGWEPWERLGQGLGHIPDRRDARIYELVPPDIRFREFDHPPALSGGRLVARYPDAGAPAGFANVKKGRRILLEQGEARHSASVTGAWREASVPGEPDDHLVIEFSPPVTASGRSLTLLGNIAEASHGETQPEEALGNGNATQAFQKAMLQRSPLTYVPSAETLAGKPELEVRVNGGLWEASDSLYARKPTERVYTLSQSDEGETTVTFGDGLTGARLPTGVMNVVARYRKGLGSAGNLAAHQLAIALERPVGLRAVTNPLPASGGADPENRDDARTAAPGTVRTFGRAVSLQDFEWIATTSGLVARAFVTWVWHELERAVHLTVAGPEGAPLSETSMTTLHAALGQARDPNRQLFLANLVRVPIVVHAKLLRDPAFEGDLVKEDALARLTGLFDFAAVPLGRAVHASEVYAALQDGTGVVAVDLDLFHLKGHDELTPQELSVRAVDSLPVQPHIRIFPARPTPADPTLIDRFAAAGFTGPEPPPVLAAEQAWIEDPASDVELTVVEAL